MAAVGIEDRAQMRVLREMGCTEVQGNALSRPRTATNLLSWLAAQA